jgi:hypothetical protein
LAALDADRPLAVQFEPFSRLRSHVLVLSDDHCVAGLVLEPGEEAMRELLSFLRDLALKPLPNSFCLPGYVEAAFRKNEKSMSEKLLREIADWPPEVAVHDFVHWALRAPIRNAIDAIGAESETVKELLPKLWMFGAVGEFPGDVHVMAECADMAMPMSNAMPRRRQGFAAMESAEAPRPMPLMMMKSKMEAAPPPPPGVARAMFSNAIMSQTASPKLFGAIGGEIADGLETADFSVMQDAKCCMEECAQCDYSGEAVDDGELGSDAGDDDEDAVDIDFDDLVE